MYGNMYCGHHKSEYYLKRAIKEKTKKLEEQEKLKDEKERNEKILKEINSKLNQQQEQNQTLAMKLNIIDSETILKFENLNKEVDTVKKTVEKQGTEGKRILEDLNDRFDEVSDRFENVDTEINRINTGMYECFAVILKKMEKASCERKQLKASLTLVDMREHREQIVFKNRKDNRELVLWQKRSN